MGKIELTPRQWDALEDIVFPGESRRWRGETGEELVALGLVNKKATLEKGFYDYELSEKGRMVLDSRSELEGYKSAYLNLQTEYQHICEVELPKLRAELEQERAKVEALRALARSQHIKLNDLEEYFKEACGYHAAIVGCFETANAQCDFDKSVFGDVMRRYKKLFDTRQAVYLENSGCVEQAEARARELGAL